jgi:ATP-dependent RNA helicase DeaD
MPEAILRVVREHIGDAEILHDAAPEDEKPAVDQFFMVLKKEDRIEALRRIIDQAGDFYGLIFCATKAGADELARRLVEHSYPAEAIHGDLSQEARERTLRRFRSQLTTILVATDVAARGLDIERLTHVVNWDLPGDRDTYVHRIGRTGRAGRRGKAVSLILPGEQGRMSQLSRSMEHVLGSGIQRIKVPSVKKVLKALKSRIVSAICAEVPGNGGEFPPGLCLEKPEQNEAEIREVPVEKESSVEAEKTPIPAEESGGTSGGIESEVPLLAGMARELIEKLGSEKALAALLSLHYGERLDPSRYSPVTDIPEVPLGALRGGFPRRGGFVRNDAFMPSGASRFKARRFRGQGGIGTDGLDGFERVYVGMGKKHGVNAADVARLLMRAGGITGRLVDAIEMKDYCAFANMPHEAARRACAFSKNSPSEPPIRFASVKQGKG